MEVTAAPKKLAPWINGIVDTLVGAGLIRQSAIAHRNRLAVILIDSAFETACRAFLQHKKNIRLGDDQRKRHVLMKMMKEKLPDVDSDVWDKIDYYYEVRCDFYHESAGKTLIDVALLEYQESVEFVIDKSFGIATGALIASQLKELLSAAQATPKTVVPEPAVSVHGLKGRVQKMLVAVSHVNPSKAEDINDYFKREGDALRITNDELTSILGRNSGSKKYFYFNKQAGRWELSGLGKFQLSQLASEDSDGR